MSVTREQVYGALFAVLSAVPGIRKASRRLEHWDEVPFADTPALYQVQSGEGFTKTVSQPYRRTFRVEVYIYVKVDEGSAVVPATVMNPILDGIENAMKGHPSNLMNTLGGLVFDAHIDGEIETDGGVLSQTMVAIIPIVVTLP